MCKIVYRTAILQEPAPVTMPGHVIDDSSPKLSFVFVVVLVRDKT